MTPCARGYAACFFLLGVICPSRARADANSSLQVRQGVYLFSQGKYQQALGYFLNALELDSTDARALYYQGRAAEALSGERRAAIGKESREIARNSLNQAERVRLAGILCARGRQALKSGELVKAAELYRESSEAFARHPCAELGLSMTRRALEKRVSVGDASADELSLAAQPPPGAPGPGSAGAPPARQGANPPPSSKMSAEPSLVPVFPSAVHWSGRQRPSEGTGRDRARAAAPAQRAPTPQDLSASEAQYLLGVAEYMSGDAPKALEALQKALELNPENDRAKNLLQRIGREAR